MRTRNKVTNGVERNEMDLIDCKTGKLTSRKFTNLEQKKKEVYNPVKICRQDQRTQHTYMLQREGWKMKTLTDSDICCHPVERERRIRNAPRKRRRKRRIQWNLSIADMLYCGHLSIADTSLRNQSSPVMVNTYTSNLSIADTSL